MPKKKIRKALNASLLHVMRHDLLPLGKAAYRVLDSDEYFEWHFNANPDPSYGKAIRDHVHRLALDRSKRGNWKNRHALEDGLFPELEEAPGDFNRLVETVWKGRRVSILLPYMFPEELTESYVYPLWTGDYTNAPVFSETVGDRRTVDILHAYYEESALSAAAGLTPRVMSELLDLESAEPLGLSWRVQATRALRLLPADFFTEEDLRQLAIIDPECLSLGTIYATYMESPVGHRTDTFRRAIIEHYLTVRRVGHEHDLTMLSYHLGGTTEAIVQALSENPEEYISVLAVDPAWWLAFH